jgi:hypothetical protein
MDREQRGPSYRSLDVGIAERVHAIVLAAEREADAARRDIAAHRRAAEAEALDYVAASRRRVDETALSRARVLEELSASALREADSLRERSSRLAANLDEIARALRGTEAPPAPPGPPWSPPEQPLEAAEPRAWQPPVRADDELPPELRAGSRPTSRDEPAAERSAEPEAARLVAIEMAVGGASRGEVERHLERQFGEQAEPSLLDGVFGPDRDSTTRLTWGRP